MRDARRLAVEIQARVNAGLVGGAVVAKRGTLGEFADNWLAMRIARPTTIRRDTGLINSLTLVCVFWTINPLCVQLFSI